MSNLSARPSTAINLPPHLNLLAKQYNTTPSSIIHLSWALVLRCYYLGTLSPALGIIDVEAEQPGKSAPHLRWESLELDDQCTISWVLQNWDDASLHRRWSSQENGSSSSDGGPAPSGLKTTVVSAKDENAFNALESVNNIASHNSIAPMGPVLRISHRGV